MSQTYFFAGKIGGSKILADNCTENILSDMMRIILLFALVFSAGAAFAQDKSPETQAAARLEEIKPLLQLDDRQSAEVNRVLLRKYRDMVEVAPLKESDPDLYIRKMRSIQTGADFSIRRQLREEQKDLFHNYTFQIRQRQADLIRTLQLQGVSPREMEFAILEME